MTGFCIARPPAATNDIETTGSASQNTRPALVLRTRNRWVQADKHRFGKNKNPEFGFTVCDEVACG
jgi:hypothetical protein